jgi:hypothetical protein
LTLNQLVVGSIPTRPTNLINNLSWFFSVSAERALRE